MKPASENSEIRTQIYLAIWMGIILLFCLSRICNISRFLPRPSSNADAKPEQSCPPKLRSFDLGDTLVGAKRSWQPGAKAALGFLKSQGFRLGVISNTGNLKVLSAILNLLPADFDLTVFETGLVLFSSEVGVEKPRKRIFEKAVSAAKVAGLECLYVSESPVETLAAQSAGMQSLRIITGSEDIAKLNSFLIEAAGEL